MARKLNPLLEQPAGAKHYMALCRVFYQYQVLKKLLNEYGEYGYTLEPYTLIAFPTQRKDVDNYRLTITLPESYVEMTSWPTVFEFSTSDEQAFKTNAHLLDVEIDTLKNKINERAMLAKEQDRVLSKVKSKLTEEELKVLKTISYKLS